MQLGGPLVVCAACGAAVHSHCSLAVMHNSICEACMLALQQDEADRQQHQAAAHQLGLISARSAQLIGTAAGAVGAGLAASRSLWQEPQQALAVLGREHRDHPKDLR